MTMITPLIARRDLLTALAALGAAAPLLAQAASPAAFSLPPGAARIGQAWLTRNSKATAAALTQRLLPDGWSAPALERLRLAVAADFRQGRVFRYRGWRLSETEGALFALATMIPA